MLESLGYIFILGLTLGSIFKKLGLPSLIGMLLAGIILGPYVLNLLSEDLLNISADLREIALLIILTRAGLSLNIEDLKKMGFTTILMSFLPACFEITATFVLGQCIFGFEPIEALLLGAVIASASPAVIVPRMIRLIKEGYGVDKAIPQLILTGDSVDDVFNIVVFSAVLGMNTGEGVSIMSFLQIPLSIIIGIIFGLLLGYVVVKWCQVFVTNTTIKVVALLSLGFLLTAFENYAKQFFPFSSLITIMATGVTLYKLLPQEAEAMSQQLAKLWVVGEVLLFVLVGATVNINYITFTGFSAIIMLIVVFFVRSLGIFCALLGSGYNMKEKLFCMFTGLPKATVQAALGGIPLAYGLASGEMILAISVIAILFTAPVGAFLLDTTYKKLLNKTNRSHSISQHS